MELKMEAAKKRKSIAQIMRERMVIEKCESKKEETAKLMKDMDRFAKKMARVTKGASFSKALIEMRYEQ